MKHSIKTPEWEFVSSFASDFILSNLLNLSRFPLPQEAYPGIIYFFFFLYPSSAYLYQSNTSSTIFNLHFPKSLIYIVLFSGHINILRYCN